MDILASISAYLLGLGALFAGLVMAFSVFFAHPREPLHAQTQAQSASVMLMRPSTPNKTAASEAHAKQNATQSAGRLQKHGTADGAQASAQTTAPGQNLRGKHAPSATQARRRIQEERARRWAYQQQEPSFQSRFLGYAD